GAALRGSSNTGCGPQAHTLYPGSVRGATRVGSAQLLDLQAEATTGRGDRYLVADGPTQQGVAHGRLVRDAAVARIGLCRADEQVLFALAILVLDDDV